MVTHDQEEALSVADRIVVMNQGVIEQVGTPLRDLPRSGDAVRRRLRRQDQRPAGRLHPGRDLRIGAQPLRLRARHRPRARRQGLPAPGGRAGAADRAGRPQRLRRRDRQDRVPRLVLPGPRRRRGDRRAAAHGLPVAQLPRRAGPRGRQPAAAASCCPSGCASSSWRARAAVSAVLAPRAARAVRQRSHWTDRVAHAALLAVARALVVFLALPLATILAKALQDKRRRTSSASPTSPSYLRNAGAAAVVLSTASGCRRWSRVVTVPLAFGFAYALTRSCMPAQGRVPHHRADPAARADAAVGDLADLLVRQPGRRQGADQRARLREHLRRARHRRGRVLRRRSRTR